MAENGQIAMPFNVNIPGVIHTKTQAYSNAQAIAYAIQQAFQTRNSFYWNGKEYTGQLGVKTLIADVLNDPALFEYAQQLPGSPSHPIEIPLPEAQPLQPENPPAPSAGSAPNPSAQPSSAQPTTSQPPIANASSNRQESEIAKVGARCHWRLLITNAYIKQKQEK